MTQTVRIGSAQELLEALSSPDPALILCVHKTIQANPVGALAFGSWQERDVVDALIEQAEAGRGMVCDSAAATLTSFEDPRVLAAFLRVLNHGRAAAVEAAAAYLEVRRHQIDRSQAYAALLQNESLHRVRCAARVLDTPGAGDPGEVSLRLGLLADGEPPPLDHFESWQRELDGVLAAETRAALLSHGRPAADWIWQVREQLSAANQAWFLEQVCRGWGRRPALQTWLDRVLREQPAVGLRCLEAAPELVTTVQQPLNELARRGPLRQRLQALRVGARLDWPQALKDETDPQLRAACLHGWGSEAPESVLLEHLRDPDWRVRAAAGDVLAQRPAAVPAVVSLLQHPTAEVRVAAVQILSAQQLHSLIEEVLLIP